MGFGLLGPRLAELAGAAQGMVLRRRLPRPALRSWIVAAIIGAMVAWGLGTLPSTPMSADAGGGQAAEMPEALTYVMAAGIGLVAGVFLALVQWFALRSHVRRAGCGCRRTRWPGSEGCRWSSWA